jgi:hypothetical protein
MNETESPNPDDPALKATQSFFGRSEPSTAEIPLSDGAQTVIGRYRLLEKIGEGGFGVVYVAEQKTPVRRRVALKIIKLGMDTRSVIARFGAERQALAMMDHPNIAKVFDAGATDTGRSYLVMELVRGMSTADTLQAIPRRWCSSRAVASGRSRTNCRSRSRSIFTIVAPPRGRGLVSPRSRRRCMTRRTQDALTRNSFATLLVFIPPSRAAMTRSRRSCE